MNEGGEGGDYRQHDWHDWHDWRCLAKARRRNKKATDAEGATPVNVGTRHAASALIDCI